jgi:DNA-binding transcriptional MocR family regulator
VTPRLARWLLTTQDHTGSSEFILRQEDLAKLLGVQRTTIVEAFRVLTEQGAIASRRGRIKLLDRASLKLAACECYAGFIAKSPERRRVEA